MNERLVVLVVSIATNRYVEFIAPLHASVRQHWHPSGVDVRFLVLTNQPEAIPAQPDVLVRPVVHKPWPAMTLERYRLLREQRDLLAAATWIVYLDADLRMVQDPGEAFLCRSFAVLHPGYAMASPGTDLPFERRPESTACVAAADAAPYVCGGVQGGAAEDFLAMCEELACATDADSAKGITARWHDESHHNRYRRDHPPERVLPPTFAFPDQASQVRAWGLGGLQPVILALSKDHAAYRHGGLGAMCQRFWQACLPLRRMVARWRGRA
jgi:hypothetical protein